MEIHPVILDFLHAHRQMDRVILNAFHRDEGCKHTKERDF
jgi:hypothetical protein